MKPISFLLAALCVTGSVATSFITPDTVQGKTLLPRGKGNDATEPHKGSSKGGLGRNNARPPNKAPHSESDAQRARDTISRGRTVKLPDRSNLRRSSTPEEGESVFTYDSRTNHGKAFLGEALEIPSRQTEMRERHDPSEKGYLYQPRAKNPEERHNADKQWRDALRSLPAKKGMVNDHKGAMSSHYPKRGQAASVAMDNERSQNLEGQLIKEVNKPVIEGGYRDPSDASTWRGVGGVELVPNAKNKAPLRPEVGPPESRPYKYSVTEDDDYGITPRKRGKGSPRSGSDDSLTLVSKPKKKSHRPGRGGKGRRDIAGVGAIASTEATASSAGSSPQNSTSKTPEDLQAYLDAWNIVRSNATDILWPFIEDMLEGTNSSLVITAAWSVYSHMLPTPYAVTGPFFYGWTSLYSQEEQWAKDSNISNATLGGLYEINDVLTDLYSTAWDGAFEALNSTGILDDLDWLGQAIMAYNTSLPVGSTKSPGDEDPYANFFLSYDSPVPDDEIDIPSTASSYSMVSGTAAPSAALREIVDAGAPYLNTTLSTATTVPTGAMI